MVVPGKSAAFRSLGRRGASHPRHCIGSLLTEHPPQCVYVRPRADHRVTMLVDKCRDVFGRHVAHVLVCQVARCGGFPAEQSAPDLRLSPHVRLLSAIRRWKCRAAASPPPPGTASDPGAQGPRLHPPRHSTLAGLPLRRQGVTWRLGQHAQQTQVCQGCPQVQVRAPHVRGDGVPGCSAQNVRRKWVVRSSKDLLSLDVQVGHGFSFLVRVLVIRVCHALEHSGSRDRRSRRRCLCCSRSSRARSAPTLGPAAESSGRTRTSQPRQTARRGRFLCGVLRDARRQIPAAVPTS